MSSGWSIFVVVLTIANILACVWLLRWTSKPKHAGEKIGGGSDTGHTCLLISLQMRNTL